MARAAKASECRVPSVTAEFAEADLGDARRSKRLLAIAEAFSAAPDRSLPKIARDAAELEAFYRFFENDAFGLEELVLPHVRATAARAREYGTVLAIHDITEFSFPFEDHLREGCEPLGSRQGFFGEITLAIAGDESRKPLGVLGCRTWTKDELPPRVKKPKPRGRRTNPHSFGRTEGTRWAQWAEESEAHVGPGILVHVMDREADGFPLFHLLRDAGKRFVIRVSNKRLVELVGDDERQNSLRAAATLESVHHVQVPLSRRRAKPGFRSHPREPRSAKLSFRAAEVVIKKSTAPTVLQLPSSMKLNFVWVLEVNAPEGVEPVEWVLATTEPIETDQDIVRIVEFYKTRWVIEEFFRALKSGCALERRQLETRGALQKVLAISLVVAWRVLLLRHESRRDPKGPALGALSELHLEVLRRTGRVPLSGNPTSHEALRAVAALGGHIKNNGDPGLIVLARGMECLLERTVGWVSAMAALGVLAEM